MVIRIALAWVLMALAGFASAQGSYEAFWKAVLRDDVGTVKQLLSRGLDPNTVDEKGEPALLVALRMDLPAVRAELMRQSTLNVDQQNAVGETALMLAIYRNQPQLARALVDRGAKPHKLGWAPLHYAADVGSMALVQWLIGIGAPVDARAPNETTPLMMAARNGHGEVAQWLVARGADKAARNTIGWRATEFAANGDFPALAKALRP